MKKSTYVIIGIAIILLVVSGVLSIVAYKQTEKASTYITGEVKSSVLDLVSNQEEINERLESISHDSSYTFESAYTELNPYSISPLSGIIIFATDTEAEIEVYINGKYSTTMEASKSHTIPIYGLYEDYENVVTLKMDDYVKDYTFKTKKSTVEYPLNVEYKSATLNEEVLYFTSASLSTYFTGWDIDGNLRFYLTTDNRMDVEWLDNGHFLIGTTQDQTREQFVGFVEMDFMGKIYNYYTLQNGYSFEFQILDNGNYMLAGGDMAIYMDHQMVYELNPNDGTVVSSLDIYDIVKAIDPDFSDKYLGASAVRNGFYYNEETGEIVVSFRDINTIFSFDYNNKTLNYVFTSNPLFDDEVWDEYKVVSKNGRYPLGQHTPTITKDGYLAFFNNGYDRYAVANLGASDSVTDYKDCYTSVEIYKIENNEATLVWSYDRNKSILSIKYGLFNILEDGHKLIDYGYILTDEYRSNSSNTIKGSESIVEGNYAEIIELDENDNVVFRATSDEGKFRAFKHTLYNETTSNVDLGMLNMYNNIEDDELDVSTYKEYDLDNAYEWIYTSNFTKNTFTTTYDIQESDELYLLFVSDTGRVYTLKYKESSNTKLKRIFNVNLATGEYALYISLNGDIYKTNTVYEF